MTHEVPSGDPYQKAVVENGLLFRGACRRITAQTMSSGDHCEYSKKENRAERIVSVSTLVSNTYTMCLSNRYVVSI